MTDRIIVLLDMDCFYVQVEERDNPEIKGHPAAVVQYNTWKGGGIIAVNYEARAFGVKRGMRGDEAKEKCPAIQLVQVPVQRGKADLTKYRNAGKEVISVLCTFSDHVERASIDEAYIDFTKVIEKKVAERHEGPVMVEDLPSTWVVGHNNDMDDDPQSIRKSGLKNWLSKLDNDEFDDNYMNVKKISVVAEICEEMRRKVLEETGFKCSAGISHNKMLAKLACGLHKPNQQTVLPMESVPLLWSKMSISKVRNLGGKLGDSVIRDLDCETMEDLSKLTLDQLKSKYDDKTSHWLFSLGKGVDIEPVTRRQLPKSIACSKNFNGKEILNTKEKVITWVTNLSEELAERLDEDRSSNDRLAKTLTVYVRLDLDEKSAITRSCPLPSYKAEAIAKVTLNHIINVNSASGKDSTWDPPIRNISLSASKFEDLSYSGTTKINDIFKKIDSPLSMNIDPTASKMSSTCEPKSVSASASNNNSDKNTQKSFFLQFLSQNTSESIKKNFLHNSEDNKNLNVDEHFSSIDSSNKEENEDLNNKECQYACKSDDGDEKYKFADNEKEINKCVPEEINDDNFLLSLSQSKRSQILSLNNSNCKGSVKENFPVVSLEHSVASKDNVLESVSVTELFPDLGNIDKSVVEMLPNNLREKVYEELEKHKKTESDADIEIISEVVAGSSSNNLSKRAQNNVSFDTANEKYKFCRECNRKILSVNFTEHGDYHFAMELRKQQMMEAKSSLVSLSKKREALKPSPSKSKTNKKHKSVDTNLKFKNRIENYFKKI